MISADVPTERQELFSKFLKLLWLRPENVLTLAIRAEKFRQTLSYLQEPQKAIDVACGDGLFAFLACGGELDEATDRFTAIDQSTVFRKGNFDAFDHYDDSYYAKITRQPELKFGHGCDWKPNLLKKASVLSFYDQLTEHDNNKPLPYKPESFNYVFSNSAYWVDRFEFHIKNLVDITEPGGHIVLEIKNDNIRQYRSDKYAPFMGEKFHEITNAGRLDTWRGLKSRKELDQFMYSLPETELIDQQPTLGQTIGPIWDIGLRPLFTPLSKMAGELKQDKRLEIKKEWCEIIFEAMKEFVDYYQADHDQAYEFIYILQKK